MRLFAHLYLCVIFLSSVTFAKGYEGREEFHQVFTEEMIASPLAEVKKTIDDLKSWEDVSTLAKTLPADSQKTIENRIYPLKNKKFNFPETVQTSTGFIIKHQGLEVLIDVTKNQISHKNKTFFYNPKSAEELMTWLEENIKVKVSSFDGLLISNAYACDPIVCPILVTIGIVALVVKDKLSDCDKSFSTMSNKVTGYVGDCEKGIGSDAIIKKFESSLIKGISVPHFGKDQLTSCVKDVEKTFKSFGFSCVKEKQAKFMCSKLSDLYICVNQGPGSVSNASRSDKKDRTANKKSRQAKPASGSSAQKQ